MNSGTASFNPSHEDASKDVSPKQTSGIPNLTLNDGNTIPMLGYGTGTARSKMINPDGPIDEELVQTILEAIKVGFRHLDGAQMYGNESEVGRAIQLSEVPRSQFYLTTKVSMNDPNDSIPDRFADSLAKLQTEYVDQYLIHSPFAFTSEAQLQQKWADMEALQASGRVRSIGVSNFLKSHLETILKTAKVVPAINQIEFHPYLQHGGLLDFHKEHGIATTAYGPLTAVVNAKPGPLDGVYAGLAKKHGVSEAEVALRWTIDRGVVTLTTSSKRDRLESYLRSVASFKLTPKEVEEVSRVGNEKHYRGFWKNKFAADDRS